MNVKPPLLPLVDAAAPRPAPAGSTAADRLTGNFSRMLAEVNGLQLRADRKIEEFATSPQKDVHGTMIALQEADLSLRLFLQIRSKLTAAYQELMRMQM